MCRFVAYIGKKQIRFNRIVKNPSNSLMVQSRRTGKLNIDGFGLSWFDSGRPIVYKSLLPPWNDENLINLVDNLSAKCFVAHTRNATVARPHYENTHPFMHKNCIFMHNGTIRDFHLVRRKFMALLDDKYYDLVQGQTDSEALFALIMQHIEKTDKLTEHVIKDIFKQVKLFEIDRHATLNTVLTDGDRMFVTRYVSDLKKECIELYYTELDDGIVVASEKLNDENKWKLIPKNTMLIIDKNKKILDIPLE